MVERYRGVSLVAIKERNAKRFFDHYTPRIKRNRQDVKPLDVVISNVHPLDVVKAQDGREVHARLIAWLDLATYDIHVSVVILDKGRSIPDGIAIDFNGQAAAFSVALNEAATPPGKSPAMPSWARSVPTLPPARLIPSACKSLPGWMRTNSKPFLKAVKFHRGVVAAKPSIPPKTTPPFQLLQARCRP